MSVPTVFYVGPRRESTVVHSDPGFFEHSGQIVTLKNDLGLPYGSIAILLPILFPPARSKTEMPTTEVVSAAGCRVFVVSPDAPNLMDGIKWISGCTLSYMGRILAVAETTECMGADRELETLPCITMDWMLKFAAATHWPAKAVQMVEEAGAAAELRFVPPETGVRHWPPRPANWRKAALVPIWAVPRLMEIWGYPWEAGIWRLQIREQMLALARCYPNAARYINKP
jgi:hypothetical protein